MPLLETKGAGSAQGFGLSLGSAERVYIEDVFSTYLYTGNGSTQTITNGIDLAGEGGLVWLKGRSTAGQLPGFFDTQRGVSKFIWSSSTAGQNTFSGFGVTGFGSSGFTIVDDAGGGYWVNGSGITYASWTFRKQPKFFDVVTYTGDGTAGRTVAHDLGSVPGCIIVKRLNDLENWDVYHRSVGATGELRLNQTAGTSTDIQFWNNTEPTSTVFTVGTNSGINASGGTYVAYLFAHNAGGFGLTGLDNVISCGTFTSGSTPVNLGWEPQFVLIKRTSGASPWVIADEMRGFYADKASADLYPNTSEAEVVDGSGLYKSATGFTYTGYSGSTFIYIAIRRGPMKVPTSGTEVFTPSLASVNTNISVGFPADLWIGNNTSGDGGNNAHTFSPRLLGTKWLQSATTSDELGGGAGLWYWDRQNNFLQTNFGGSRAEYLLRRAPGFFDVVCYTGTGVSGRAIAHNLGVVPEMMIGKNRSNATDWTVYHTGATYTAGPGLKLNTTAAGVSNTYDFGNSSGGAQRPDASSVYLGGNVNSTNDNYLLYLFATLAGVSKVGSYTGTGTTQVINCGFTAGARFVLIKRTDSTGDWYVWDSARGIVAGNDPYLLLNSTAAEVTSTDYVDTASTGFEISSTAPAAINANGGTFIFLAIA